MISLHPYEEALLKAARADSRLIICTGETRHAMRNLDQLLHDRFVDVGISEQTLIGMAAGLAMMGSIPICHGLATFLLMRPYEFIRTDLGFPDLPVLLVGSFAGFLSEANGPTHQAIDDISLMSQVPNMKIIAPANLSDTIWVIREFSNNIDSPIYLRFNDYVDAIENDKEQTQIEWGKNELFHKGSTSVLIVSYGLCFSLVKNAFQEIKELSLLKLLFVWPLDTTLFSDIFNRYDTIIVVEDHRYVGSLCYHIKVLGHDMGYRGRVAGINLGDRFFEPLLLDDILKKEKFDCTGLRSAVNSIRSDRI